jgi:hypothetical protein
MEISGSGSEYGGLGEGYEWRDPTVSETLGHITFDDGPNKHERWTSSSVEDGRALVSGQIYYEDDKAAYILELRRKQEQFGA